MEKLDKRQQDLLYKIIEYYIKSATPVGSKQLSEDLNLSSATIRNEMSELEKLGYLIQPHISAGRIPTQNAYKFYIESILKDNKKNNFDWPQLEECDVKFDCRDDFKNLAKKLADILELSIIVAFSKHDIFYTGMSKLFSQPEFKKTLYMYQTFQIFLIKLMKKLK